MTIMVRDLPNDERPREKLLAHGASYLTNTELLAILLRTGTAQRSVLRVAEEVLAHYRDRGLSGIVHMSPAELARINGVGMAKAATILAAVELGRRIGTQAADKVTHIGSPADAAAYLIPRFRHEQQEHFAAIMLNAKNNILGLARLTVGTLTSSPVHPRDVFRAALDYYAASVIITHNHPSGDPMPSTEDIAVTKRMVEAGDLMGIAVSDHVIVAGGRYFSFLEQGLLR